ncbi:MAG: sodium:proton antiporter [Vicinamibacterales bacterium]
MQIIYALVIAVIAACGVQLLLSRHMLRTLLGITLISAAANLTLFFAGRIGPTDPPVIAIGEVTLPSTAANPLPQALILTAIVIGFALTAFGAALVLQTHRTLGTLDGRRIKDAERLGSAFDDVSQS